MADTHQPRTTGEKAWSTHYAEGPSPSANTVQIVSGGTAVRTTIIVITGDAAVISLIDELERSGQWFTSDVLDSLRRRLCRATNLVAEE